LGLLETGIDNIGAVLPAGGEGHAEEADIKRICEQFAAQCDHHEELLRPFTDGMGLIRPASRNVCTPTVCPRRVAVGWDCCAIFMTFICWRATWIWRGH
jgi:hypothetical protein